MKKLVSSMLLVGLLAGAVPAASSCAMPSRGYERCEASGYIYYHAPVIGFEELKRKREGGGYYSGDCWKLKNNLECVLWRLNKLSDELDGYEAYDLEDEIDRFRVEVQNSITMVKSENFTNKKIPHVTGDYFKNFNSLYYRVNRFLQANQQQDEIDIDDLL